MRPAKSLHQGSKHARKWNDKKAETLAIMDYSSLYGKAGVAGLAVELRFRLVVRAREMRPTKTRPSAPGCRCESTGANRWDGNRFPWQKNRLKNATDNRAHNQCVIGVGGPGKRRESARESRKGDGRELEMALQDRNGGVRMIANARYKMMTCS